MLSLGAKDASLSIDVRGYQFPDSAMDGWDSEWLQVHGSAECAQGRWRFSDPCLTTFELARLATWLREVPTGGLVREMEFIEPCLRFEHVERSEEDVLIVRLSQEASPPWATESQRYGEGVTLEFPFSALNFETMSSAVSEMYGKYPQRTRGDAG